MAITSFINADLLGIAFNRETLTACLAILIVVLVLYKKVSSKKYNLPPGPTGVPILGYLPFLGKKPFRKLDELRKKYGNIFRIRMGMTPVVILADYEAVTEVYNKPSSNGRPEGIFDFLPDAVGFASANGAEWSEQRKFCVRSMRGQGIGRDKWESIVEIEVNDIVNLISSYKGQPFDISGIVLSSVSNNIATFVFGKRLPLNHPDRAFLDRAIEEMMVYFSSSSILAYFPTLSNICVALGVGIAAKTYRSMVLFNNFFRKEAAKMKETYKNSEHDNFMVDYLKEMDNYKGKTGHFFKDRNMFGNIQTLFVGGSDTTAISIFWLFLAMAKYPDIQAKVQEEVDSVLDKDGHIQWTEKKKLPYTYATIMEGQRWRTTVPLNVTRMALEDIRVQNYDIPKGTTIITNSWGLHQDPKYWKDPETFEPKRFLTKDGSQVITKPESYVAFSIGKRSCPGEVVAMMEILMYFATIVQKFKILVPKGKTLNLDGIMGITYRAYPQELQFIPREK